MCAFGCRERESRETRERGEEVNIQNHSHEVVSVCSGVGALICPSAYTWGVRVSLCSGEFSSCSMSEAARVSFCISSGSLLMFRKLPHQLGESYCCHASFWSVLVVLFLLEHPGLDAQQSGYEKPEKRWNDAHPWPKRFALWARPSALYTLRKAEKRGAFSR